MLTNLAKNYFTNLAKNYFTNLTDEQICDAYYVLVVAPWWAKLGLADKMQHSQRIAGTVRASVMTREQRIEAYVYTFTPPTDATTCAICGDVIADDDAVYNVDSQPVCVDCFNTTYVLADGPSRSKIHTAG